MEWTWKNVVFNLPIISWEQYFIAYCLITYIMAAITIRRNNVWFNRIFEGNENPPVIIIWMCSPVWIIPYYISNFLTKR